MSNGGMMAHRLAAEAGDVIAVAAPVAGGMVLPLVESPRAVPLFRARCTAGVLAGHFR